MLILPAAFFPIENARVIVLLQLMSMLVMSIRYTALHFKFLAVASARSIHFFVAPTLLVCVPHSHELVLGDVQLDGLVTETILTHTPRVTG